MSNQNETRVVHLTTRADLINFVKNNDYVIVKTSATWCGPCKQVKPCVDNWINNKLPDNIKVVLVDADEGADILSFLRWRSLPTFGNFIRGEHMDVFVGVNQTQIDKFFQKTVNRSKGLL
jgi:thioredoxin-like negative regulator of GroEL